jgi:fibronectin-binding autotransporter adhesin
MAALAGGTAGSLIKVGTGTLTLSGANTYTGGTTISAGTLQLGAGGATGSIKGNVINNSVFAINRSDTFTFGGNISGTGSFQQLGSGMTILTAANSYSGGTTERQSSPLRTATAGAQRFRQAYLMERR